MTNDTRKPPTREEMERRIDDWMGRTDLGLHERTNQLKIRLAALGCCQPEPRAVGWWVGAFPGAQMERVRWWNGDNWQDSRQDFEPRALLVEKPQ